MPSNSPLMQRLDDGEFALRIVLRIGEKHHQPDPSAFSLDRADDVAEIGIRDRRYRDADALGGRRLERARQRVGPVTDALDRGFDEPRRFGHHAARSIDDVGNRRDRDAGLPRDIDDRGRRRVHDPARTTLNLRRFRSQPARLLRARRLGTGRSFSAGGGRLSLSKRLRNRFDGNCPRHATVESPLSRSCGSKLG